LTHFLLEALQGAEEVRRAGKVSVYRLLENMTTRVVDAARQFGARQEPTLPDLLATWAESIPSLNELQPDAINAFGVLDGADLIVSASTSSGKTLVGELAALKGVLERKRALFLLPMKALVNDKYAELTRKYDALACG
jgi:helicase